MSGPTRYVKVTDHFTCIYANVIYCITSTLCQKIYKGEKGRRLAAAFANTYVRDGEKKTTQMRPNQSCAIFISLITPTTSFSLKEIKPRIVNQHSVVYCFQCDLCDSNYVGYTTRHLFQRIADHRYSAIGHHLRDAHGNIDLLNDNQFRMLKNVARNGIVSFMKCCI